MAKTDCEITLNVTAVKDNHAGACDSLIRPVYEPTDAECFRFFKTQLARASQNLENAEKRGDKKAAANIQHKIGVYRRALMKLAPTPTVHGEG